jgi:hypothetical protein
MGIESCGAQGRLHGSLRAIAARIRLSEMMGIGTLAVAQDLRKRGDAAPPGIGQPLEDHNAVSLAELHAPSVFRKRHDRVFGYEPKAVESRIRVLTERVVTARDHQIELATTKQGQPQGNARQARSAS